jgi:predicted TIM-barrel fold metal-dependent hydrolase
MTDRREFLRILAAAGAGTIMPASGLLGQERVVKLNVRGGAINVHHHYTPPGLTAAAGNRGAAPAAGGRTGAWTPERSIEQMDKFGIGVSIVSMTMMGDILYDGTEKGRAAVRAGNEYGAKLMQQYPRRFGLFGGLPLPDVDGALKEIEYAYDTLKVDGIGVYTNDTKGRWLGDKYFEPMWQELTGEKRSCTFTRSRRSAAAILPITTSRMRAFRFRWWPLRQLMPESRILFGTDYSPEPIESTVNELPGLKLTKEFEQMLLRGNAERLFPRFRI